VLVRQNEARLRAPVMAERHAKSGARLVALQTSFIAVPVRDQLRR
jgi:hypothetical protein